MSSGTTGATTTATGTSEATESAPPCAASPADEISDGGSGSAASAYARAPLLLHHPPSLRSNDPDAAAVGGGGCDDASRRNPGCCVTGGAGVGVGVRVGAETTTTTAAAAAAEKGEFFPPRKKFIYVPGGQSYEKRLVCCLCGQPLEDPVEHVACGAVFCSSCTTYNKSSCSIAGPQCPGCNRVCKTTQLRPLVDEHLLSELGRILVLCPNCHLSVTRADYENHVSLCPMECRNGCGDKTVLPRSIALHNEVCSAYIVSCIASSVRCPWKGPRSGLATHSANCPYVALQPLLQKLLSTIKTQADTIDQQQQHIRLLSEKGHIADIERIQKSTQQHHPISNSPRSDTADCDAIVGSESGNDPGATEELRKRRQCKNCHHEFTFLTNTPTSCRYHIGPMIQRVRYPPLFVSPSKINNKQ
ncbi:hypothetical protein Pelo_10737 [Pelomyxa schiedti]|nr:hypothetical protein Pelo_10687 [Pelomyxa schiedti]KAH3757512.1 hypothetical protein Pelo_10737 [Pelomyxa schiedti]